MTLAGCRCNRQVLYAGILCYVESTLWIFCHGFQVDINCPDIILDAGGHGYAGGTAFTRTRRDNNLVSRSVGITNDCRVDVPSCIELGGMSSATFWGRLDIEANSVVSSLSLCMHTLSLVQHLSLHPSRRRRGGANLFRLAFTSHTS